MRRDWTDDASFPWTNWKPYWMADFSILNDSGLQKANHMFWSRAHTSREKIFYPRIVVRWYLQLELRLESRSGKHWRELKFFGNTKSTRSQKILSLLLFTRHKFFTRRRQNQIDQNRFERREKWMVVFGSYTRNSCQIDIIPEREKGNAL